MILRSMAVCVLALGACAGQAPPAETPREQVENITSSRHEYRLHMDGTVDGVNTRDPVIYKPWQQGFEPMRLVRVENTGDTDIVNPWVVVNGKRDWRTAASIVQEALRAQGDPLRMSEADKARAIYEFFRTHRFHATTGDLEVRDPVKLFNVYGYALCGDNAPALMDLWRVAGLKVRRGFPNGHCVVEAWYDGAWHLLDADEAMIFLDRDNTTIAGDRDVARDHDLIKRAVDDQTDAAMYSYDGPRSGEFPSHAWHAMSLRLRPGESLEWRWSHVGKHHYVASGLYSMKSPHLRVHWGDEAWARLCNGKWVYAPPLRTAAAQRGVKAEGVLWSQKASEPAVRPVKTGEPASLVWKMEAPYVIVGGNLRAKVRAKAGSSCAFLVSADGRDWKEVFRTGDGLQGEINVDLDDFFASPGPPRYGYFVRADLVAKSAPADIGIDSIRIENDLQMAPLSLPALELGDNTVRFSDDTSEPHSARVTFQWVERSSATPPPAPSAAMSPADGAQVEGTQLTLRWQAPKHPAGDKIVEYFFQLGDNPALRWALSSAFEQIVPATEAAPSFSIGRPGLLNPGQRYYWRVRAKSEKGVWSPWSSVWSFIPQGPGVPLQVRLARAENGTCTLAWNANPGGRPVAAYLVYASNEKGFSVSDAPYQVNVGNQKERGLFPGKHTMTFPANLLTKTAERRLVLNPEQAFYRVVAVDEKGIRSGPSDYAATPRPLIYSKPVQEVRVGVPYRYEVKTISSIGDLTYRDFPPDESYQGAFWEPDQPRFSFMGEIARCGNNDPGWLKLDPRTGVLSGTPKAEHVGEYQVNIRVDIPGAGVDLQSFPLKVSN